MKCFDSARARLRLLFARRAAESRMNDEFRFHIEMETDRLMRAKGLERDEARRQALAAFGGVEKHKEALRDGRGLAWLSGTSLDVRLGGRMLLKYPGLTLAGGLALAMAIGIGAGWYDLIGKVMAPTIPLPEGDRIVLIETQNVLTNEPELRVVRDFLEWRRELQTIENLGAYRTDTRNLVVGDAAPEPIQMAELTAAAFGTARVPPLLGRALLDSDEMPGAPGVLVIGYDRWRRSFGGRHDVAGSVVKLGKAPATVIGVMPEGFAYPVNHDAWTPLSLRASYEALEGGTIGVIGRLAPGVSQEQANAELRVFGERTAAAVPATHEHLRPRVRRLGEASDDLNAPAFAMRNLPVLLVLIIACVSVGTLVYARTATREGEIAVRSALGASRARIIGQLFVEALVLASVAAVVGLIAADRAVMFAIQNFNRASGGVPFWVTPGLKLSTILYAGGLAAASAVMLSVLPALKATRADLQSHLASRGAGGATLRFGHFWTGAMIVQVTLTAIGIPVALEGVTEARRNANIRAAFPGREYLAARIDVDRPFDGETTPAFQARRARTFAELQRRIAQEPGVVAVTFADRVPGSWGSSIRGGQVEASAGAGPAYAGRPETATVGPGFFEMFDRPIVAGRAFHEGDRSPGARTVIVNEAFVREFSRSTGSGPPIGARVRYSAPSAHPGASEAERWFEIVGVVRDIGLNPDDMGDERPFVFHTAPADTVSPFVMSVRVRGNAATFAAGLPVMASDVDASLLVAESRSVEDWIQRRDGSFISTVATQAAVPALGLFLSAMSIFSLVSVSVSRRRHEIGVRAALGARPRHLLSGIMTRAIVLMGSGIAAGGGLLLWAVASGAGPSGRPADDVAQFAVWLGVTSAVMLAACLLACIGPARRALRINPTDALREA
jgi:putative ABC transport system permease protein